MFLNGTGPIPTGSSQANFEQQPRGALGLQAESADFLRLDLVRFLAAIAVVIHHFESNLGVPHSIAPGLPFFVDVFFAISGIVIAYVYSERIANMRGFIKFMQARVARLVPLHWLLTLAYVAISLSAGAAGLNLAEPDRYNLECLPPVFTLIHSVAGCERNVFNYVSWSVSAEMALYLVFPVLLLTIYRSKIALLISSALTLVFLNVFMSGWWDLTYNGGALRAFPGFLLGLTFWKFHDEIKSLKVPGSAFMPTVLALLAIMVFVRNPQLTIHAAYIFVFFVFAMDCATAPNRFIAWLAPLGVLTYSIYMLHPIANTILISLLAQKIMKLEGIAAITYAWGLVALLIPMGLFSYYVFETPVRRVVKSWKI